MTDHNDNTGSPTPHDGDYDPIVAERFRVLERVTPPDVASPAMRMAVPRGTSGVEPSGRRSGFLMAVAASVGVLVVGVIAVVATTGGDGTDLSEEAGQTDDVIVAADGASDVTAPLVVEGDSGASSTTRAEADGAATATDDAGAATEGSGGTDVADQGADRSSTAAPETSDGPSQNEAAGSGDSGDPATTTADGPAVVMPADDADRPIVTFSTATTDVLPTTGGGDSTVALRGTVTEVFTDCVSRLVLSETGQVVQGGPVSCDGGSYIVVSGTRVFTSSGFTSADLAFDKHPSNLKPGQEVSVTAVRTGGASGPLTLNCDSCRVRVV